MEATASSASRTGSTTGGEDSSAVASVGGSPEGSAGCVAVVSVGGNPAVGGVGGRGDSEGGRGAAVGGRAAASRRESDWRGAAVGGLRWGGRATGLNLFWLAAGGQCGGSAKTPTHGDGETSRAICGCSCNNNSKTKIIHNITPRIPLPCLPPACLFHSPPRAYPPKASANPVCAFAPMLPFVVHSYTHTRTHTPTMFAPALLRTARPAASRIAPIASRLASSSTKLTIANENFPLPTGEEVDPQCTSLLLYCRHTTAVYSKPTLTLFRMDSERLPSTPQCVFAESIPFRLVGYPGAQELW